MKETDRENNLDMLRLLAAWLVMVSHGWALIGLPEHDFVWIWTRGGFGASGLGLAVFFSISGFLIDRSARSSPGWKAFVRRRFLRLWPGLAVVVVASVLVLGPVFGARPMGAYFADPMTWLYVATLSIWGMRWQLPGLFDGNPVPAVNGSLWTLPYEATFYAMSWWLGKLRGRVGEQVPVLLFGAGLLAQIALGDRIASITFRPLLLSVRFLLEFGLFYLAGTILNRLWSHKAALVATAFVLAVIWIAALGHDSVRRPLDFLVLPMVTLLVGFYPIRPFSRIGRIADLSYGMYVWGFPVQQILVLSFGPERFQPWSLTLCGVLATLPVAAISWFLVEKPALVRKDQPLRLLHWKL